jgi:hypothetical protein
MKTNSNIGCGKLTEHIINGFKVGYWICGRKDLCHKCKTEINQKEEGS